MRFKGLASAAVLSGALLWGYAAYSAPPAGDATAGKDVFQRKCKTCHGEDGNGNQGMAKMLKVTFVPLSADEVQSKSDADIKKIIVEGNGKMKAVKEVNDTDIANVIAYVRTFKK